MEIPLWYKANKEHDSRRKTIWYYCNNDLGIKGNTMLEIQFWYHSNDEHVFKVILKQQLFFFKGNANLVITFGMIYWIYNFGQTPGNKVYKCKNTLAKGSETRMLK